MNILLIFNLFAAELKHIVLDFSDRRPDFGYLKSEL